MMKKLIISIMLIIGFSLLMNAQDFTKQFTYEDFQAWMKDIIIEGYTFNVSEVEGSAENNDIRYQGVFNNGQASAIIIGMNEGKGIKEIISKKEPGIEICKINDCEAVYYSIEGTPMTYIFINLPGIEAFLSFMCMPAESKEEMEKLLEQTKWFEVFAIKVD